MKFTVLGFMFALFCSAVPVWAEGIVVPTAEGLVVLHGDSLAEVRRIPWEGEPHRALTAHPASPVLASVAGEELFFWNLPSFAKASSYRDPLLAGATDIAFSLDGDELYLLSPTLRSVVVFDLGASKIEGLLPIPGGVPRSFSVTREGVLVVMEEGVALLSPDPRTGLLGQFRFSEEVLAAAAVEGRLLVSRSGAPALELFDLTSGKSLGSLPAGSPSSQILPHPAGAGVLALSPSGSLAAWSFGRSEALWSGRGDFDLLLEASESDRVYAVALQSGTIAALETQQGREVARAQLGQAVLGEPAVFRGEP